MTASEAFAAVLGVLCGSALVSCGQIVRSRYRAARRNFEDVRILKLQSADLRRQRDRAIEDLMIERAKHGGAYR